MHTSGEPTGENGGLRISRRQALIAGSIATGGLMVGSADGLTFDAPAADAALPTTTEPEQLRLTWGADPATEVTVSWSTPGTVQMTAPMLAYSTSPITDANPGALVFLPHPEPLDLAKGPRTQPCVTSFTDGQTAQTTYHYHVPLVGLEPDTTYYYVVSDGDGSSVSASFQTAPTGRAPFRFTAFGDQGSGGVASLNTLALTEPGDGKGAPLFHLMVGDLAYADGSNPPATWRAWATMVSSASQSFPWMPVMGNHELEQGVTDLAGVPQTTGTSADYYNGPYGSGSYFSRFLLPDNGLTNWDGNSLQGNFYSFRVGTVLFISLAGNDVNWQTGDYSQTKPQYYTGDVAADPLNMALVPTGETPNLQIQWLEETLQAARAEGSGVEMIVVQMHFPFASVCNGNACDMGVRTAFGPLFDKYQVDLTLTGHNHNYCRSLPTRGYDPPSGKASRSISNPFGTYAPGEPIDTRRPTVQQAEPITVNGQPTFDTSRGTVHLVVGGGGAASTIGETFDPVDGLPQAFPFAMIGLGIPATEDALWLGFYDTENAYGYGVFDVDPGNAPGETSITFQWFSVTASGPLPTSPLEKFVFARMARQLTGEAPAIHGTVSVGHTVTAVPGDWEPSSIAFTYQWLLGGTEIPGADGDSYTIKASDLGEELQVKVTGTLEGYASTTKTSSAMVVAGGQLQPSAVLVSGTPKVGGTVTAEATPWTPVATLAYQWLLDGTPIRGATGSSYSPVAGDAGHVLQVRVSGDAPGYEPASVTSVPQTVAAGAAGTSIATPRIAGAAAVGDTVKAVTRPGPDAAAGLGYQWLVDGAPVAGATAPAYTPAPTDAGKQLQVKLSSRTQSTISKPEVVKAAKFRTASRPGFRGTAAVGGRLTVIVGRWLPSPSFDYQWLADGKPIHGATEPAFVPTAAQVGESVAVRVTARRTGYRASSTTSDAVEVKLGALHGPRPRIVGHAGVGSTLHVERGAWKPQPELGYQWLVNGRAARDRSTGIAYKVRPEDYGKRISVRITGRLPGYEPLARVSKSTARVSAA